MPDCIKILLLIISAATLTSLVSPWHHRGDQGGRAERATPSIAFSSSQQNPITIKCKMIKFFLYLSTNPHTDIETHTLGRLNSVFIWWVKK